MGAGKSSAAREAAAALGVEAVDADALLSRELGEPIEAFFDREGEAAFRAARGGADRRRARARPTAASSRSAAARCGSERVRAALARHTVVLVDVDLEHGVGARARPRAAAGPRPRRLRGALRTPAPATYEAAADAVLPGSARGAAGRARSRRCGRCPAGHTLLWAHERVGRLPRLGRAGCETAAVARRRPADRRHRRDGGRRCTPGASPTPPGVIEIPPGEEHKTLDTAERVWRALVAQGATRADHVVALGGGVVGDLAGFCAATYQRGMPVVQVPTTLVAQVDSAYGGKTGVDLPEAKNYVGAYHQPAAVLVDGALLGDAAAGRARRRLRRGRQDRADRRRHAVGARRPRRARRRRDRPRLRAHEARVVAADERDGGRRQVLNLGHTVGHAIETVTGYGRYRHGEAVGLGLLAALRLQRRRRAARAGRGAAGARRAADRARRASTRPTVVAATRATRSARASTTPFVLVDAPGRRRPTATRSSAADLLGAVRELTRDEHRRPAPRRGPARRQPRPARPRARRRTTAR